MTENKQMSGDERPLEFEGDLAGAEFWGADMRGAHFRDVDLSDTTITHAWLVGVTVDGFVDRLVVNGVDVTDFVNAGDRWYPLRRVLRPSDLASMRDGWAMLRRAWDDATHTALRLPADTVHASVDGEWSFVQTLRHLLLATDKWFTLPVLGGMLSPLGIAHSSSTAFGQLDGTVHVNLDEVLAVRSAHAEALDHYLAEIDDSELSRVVDIAENGPHEIRQCIATVLEEEFWHLRYADRDLSRLSAQQR